MGSINRTAALLKVLGPLCLSKYEKQEPCHLQAKTSHGGSTNPRSPQAVHVHVHCMFMKMYMCVCMCVRVFVMHMCVHVCMCV